MACARSAALPWALAEAGLEVEPEAEVIRAADSCPGAAAADIS